MCVAYGSDFGVYYAVECKVWAKEAGACEQGGGLNADKLGGCVDGGYGAFGDYCTAG